MKKKRNLYIIAFLCFITLVGVTIAYLQSTDTFENIFKAGTYRVVTHEEFSSPDNWKPGDITPKTITSKNEGTIPVRVRVKLDEAWLGNNNNELPLYFKSHGRNAIYEDEYEDFVEKIALTNFDNATDWVYKDGYFYYKKELKPNESTKSLIKSVTFNPNYNGDIVCHKDSNNNNVCDTRINSYLGGSYHLLITTETVQSDQYKKIWNIDLENKVESNPCTYEGELVSGAQYVNGQYTYEYIKNSEGEQEKEGWRVFVTDSDSTEPITTKICTLINNKPIIIMGGMFYNSKAESIDLSSFDTSNVTNMNSMFASSEITSLDFSNFDTSKVTDMDYMFYNYKGTELDLSSFDFSNLNNAKYMFNVSSVKKVRLRSLNEVNILKEKLHCSGIAFYVLDELVDIDDVC